MKIAMLGDIALFGKFDIRNNKDLETYFSEMRSYLTQFDIVIGNLETPLRTDQKPILGKSAHISTNIESIQILKYLNINYVNLANNHIFDYGLKSYELTKKTLDELGIRYFGVEDLEIKIEMNDYKIALSGYCCGSSNPTYHYSNGHEGVNLLSYETIIERMEQNHQAGYLNIISIHAGEEHTNIPDVSHIKLGRLLAQKVPYIYYGHHPHVLQGIEEKNGSLLAYSLGNFCFDDVYTKKSRQPLIKQNENNKNSIVLSLTVNNADDFKWDYKPFYIGDKKMSFLSKQESMLIDYSNILKLNYDEISKLRSIELENYYSNRKKKRNIRWYLKRLNVNSILILNNAKKNKLYFEGNLKKYLE